ncbi:MAG: hypothetical protein ACFE9R_01810 [Candidatus Hermodarchaeota archaeon]
MSKVQKWQFNDLFESRRDKLINLLLSEIIFLKSKCKKVSNKNVEEYLEIALKKLDFTLNVLKNYEHELNDNDYDKIILIIYNIFRDTLNKLEN